MHYYLFLFLRML